MGRWIVRSFVLVVGVGERGWMVSFLLAFFPSFPPFRALLCFACLALTEVRCAVWEVVGGPWESWESWDRRIVCKKGRKEKRREKRN